MTHFQCIHCGRPFQSIQGLKIHDASHRRNNNHDQVSYIQSVPKKRIENSTRDMERYKINTEIDRLYEQEEYRKQAVDLIKGLVQNNVEQGQELPWKI